MADEENKHTAGDSATGEKRYPDPYGLYRRWLGASKDVWDEANEGEVSSTELAELWSSTGLEDVRFGSLVVSADYSDFEDLWWPLPTGVGPAGAFTKALAEDRRQTLRAALQRRLGVGDEPFELSARAWAVAGQKP